MFANKVVIVTGSSAGIGAATVELFAKEGASVAIVGRNEEKLKEVAKRCEQHGAKTLIIKADVSKEEEAKTIVQKTVDKFGKLDVLVNNAGILRFASILQPNFLQNYDEVMNTNMRPVILITNLAVPYLTETKGSIINISSTISVSAKVPGTMSYSISKAAMDQFTRFAAVELAPSGVRVNSVNPGPVATDIVATAGIRPEELQTVNPANVTLLGRPSDADEIGDVILFLASDKAKSVTGSSYVIDNGFLLK
ncbi:hypothetical protein PYW08_008459 [Mythimna loreyi]|uniref:Uncharacterized protein n=1 Tax=Mythimna loreyi TaxID=667449 RepID=A0ACC2QDD8_9NEOP|nr:hypothetical protein PYW08_008459 [Mythimna loreyi]